jgi:hypothetical protein
MENITISKKLAYDCASALVNLYNREYETLGAATRYYSMKTLYAQLIELGYPSMIAVAKGDDDLKGLVLNFTMEKLEAYQKKHKIGKYKEKID